MSVSSLDSGALPSLPGWRDGEAKRAIVQFVRAACGEDGSDGVPHDDSEREFAYTAGAEQALEEAGKGGWTVVSIKNDWAAVF
jgi:hypothetical protein